MPGYFTMKDAAVWLHSARLFHGLVLMANPVYAAGETKTDHRSAHALVTPCAALCYDWQTTIQEEMLMTIMFESFMASFHGNTDANVVTGKSRLQLCIRCWSCIADSVIIFSRFYHVNMCCWKRRKVCHGYIRRSIWSF